VTRRLAVRLDSDGDVLLTGPAVRAMAASGPVDVLAGPSGHAAAALLPGVEEVLVFASPWTGVEPPAVEPAAVEALVATLRERRYDQAVVFTSYHQSPLPAALLLRLAGVPSLAATSEDYPGSLLDVRHRRGGAPDGTGGGHEVEAALALAAAAGHRLPAGDDGRLRVRGPLPDPAALLGTVAGRRYVVVHPGASVPARAPSPQVAAAIVRALTGAGWPVVVTGGPAETALAGAVCRAATDGVPVVDVSGRTDLPALAGVLAGAAAVVVGNTGPAHLAAAVGTPVVSLFAPVVPAERWAPWGVPSALLGDDAAACALSRARDCPVPGHPCLDLDPVAVVAAVDRLARRNAAPVPAAGLAGAVR
jgi:heptosyltransferase III